MKEIYLARAMNYTFANFVIGAANQFAHAAALAVANLPARAYNPLFIHGGSGLGKTHLLRAIGEHVQQRAAMRRVTYLPAERFVSEWVHYLQHNQTADFRHHYRQVDMLLVDDIQYLAGKQRAQEEFFHTFNALIDAERQIVLTSDRPPQDLAPLEPRLRSRFTAGLMAAIQPPDLETRLAILQRKAAQHDLVLSQDVAMLMASQLRTNVPDLEVAMARLTAYASLYNHAEVTVDMAETMLSQLFAERAEVITAARIQSAVAERLDLKVGDLRSKNRRRAVAFARQVAMFLCRELTNASLPEIGRDFGGKDHSTVLHACTKIAGLEETDEDVARLLWQLRRALGK
jgi:chromosomal replication initiator protein